MKKKLEFFASDLKRAFYLAWQADKKSIFAIQVLTIVRGLLPVAQAWVAKLIIDSVVDSLSRHLPEMAALKKLALYLIFEFALVFSAKIISQIKQLLQETTNHKIGFSINSQIMTKASRLELHYFENAAFYDKMQNARQQSEFRAMAILNAAFQVLENFMTLASFLVILITISPWLGLLLLLAAVPAFVAQNKYGQLNFRLQTWKAPETRKMKYYEHLLTVDSSAKEIQTFSLNKFFQGRHAELFWKVFREDEKLAWQRSSEALGWGLLSTLSYYACYVWVILKTVANTIGLGSMTMYLMIFRQSQGTFDGIFDGCSRLYENGLFMKTFFEFLDLPEIPVTDWAKNDFVIDPSRGVEFKNVSFRYPNQSHWTIENLNLAIGAGEKIALVGENGSGKTTLIKLLMRLYEPTAGDIFYQGINLKDWPKDDLRKKIGVIFQDFVRYQSSLLENVGFGSVEDLSNFSRVQRAAQRGGMLDLISDLDEGWETVLGGWFQKGRELSGGQWQKVALSRAFMREGEVIILDEPTSALDAEKEYEIFSRFHHLTEKKTAVLISHRFSTVRMADRIVVLRDGKIIEQGPHPELMLKQGVYAKLFNLQADGYR